MIALGDALRDAGFADLVASRLKPAPTGMVRVAVIDSGIYAGHPHVPEVAGGVCLIPGANPDDLVDRNGHGTAVAAAILEKAPGIALLAVKVFDRVLATTAAALARGIEWSAEHSADVVNLSLGTTNPAHAALLQHAVDAARARGAIVVAATDQGGVPSLPGSLTGVVAVSLDWDCPRDTCIVHAAGPEVLHVRASGYPRPIPGVPLEKNLKGISFAVANVAGLIARTLPSLKSSAAR